MIIHLLIAASITVSASHAKADAKIINNSWYTMQAGSTPWGYFHEVIEQRDGRYSYRYAMKKVEKGAVYEENIGAICKDDLTPVAFNINKSGGATIETTDATYATNQFGGTFAVEVKGAKSASFKRTVKAGTILDVFFPLWLKQNWSKLKPGYKGWVSTFAETDNSGDFLSRTVNFKVREMDTAKGCLKIHVEVGTIKVEWCMTPEAVLLELDVSGTPNFHIRRVKDEKEAVAFLKGVMPKAKQ